MSKKNYRLRFYTGPIAPKLVAKRMENAHIRTEQGKSAGAPYLPSQIKRITTTGPYVIVDVEGWSCNDAYDSVISEIRGNYKRVALFQIIGGGKGDGGRGKHSRDDVTCKRDRTTKRSAGRGSPRKTRR